MYEQAAKSLTEGDYAAAETQFGQVIQFQAEIYYDPAEQEAAPEICRILEDKGLPYAQVRRSGLLFRSGDKLYTGTAIVSEPEALTGFYGLKAADSKADISAADSGVLIPSRMSTYFKLLPGDVLQAYSSSLEPKEIPVTGVFNNHFGHLLFFLEAEGAAFNGVGLLYRKGFLPYRAAQAQDYRLSVFGQIYREGLVEGEGAVLVLVGG